MNDRHWSMLYGFWALAVCSRALWQYASRSGNLLPSHISLLAGIIYLVITWAALRHQHTVLRGGLVCEIIGVIAVSRVPLHSAHPPPRRPMVSARQHRRNLTIRTPSSILWGIDRFLM